MTAQTIESWQEVFLFSIEIMDGTAVEFAGITNDITAFEVGDKDIESTPLANGGRNVGWTPQADGMCTMKVYPTDAKSTSGKGLIQLFNPQTTADNTDPIKVVNTRTRNKHQAIWTWAEDLSAFASVAGSASSANEAAYRRTAKNVYITGHKWNSDDRRQSVELTLKWAPFGLTGNDNYKEESTITTAIPLKTSFTTANQNDTM